MNYSYTYQRRIQEFHNRGARSRRGRILGIWGLFWCPFAHTQWFIVRVDIKVHILNTAWWLQFKYMRILQSKFTNTTPKKFKRGGGARRPGAGSAFAFSVRERTVSQLKHLRDMQVFRRSKFVYQTTITRF